MTSSSLWFVGIDWGSTTHHVCLLHANGSVRGSRAFPHSGAGQAELVRWLLEQTGAAAFPDRRRHLDGGGPVKTCSFTATGWRSVSPIPHPVTPVSVRASRVTVAPLNRLRFLGVRFGP